MPVRDEDHRVVARAMAAFLGGAEEQSDFVAGEVIAESRFAGHANNLPRTPSPSSPHGKQYQSLLAARKKVPARVALSLFLQTGVQGSQLAT